MPNRDLFVIGSSLGGIGALGRLLRQLPRDLQASLFIAQHAGSGGALGEVLSPLSELPVDYGQDGQLFERGRVYLAPPDRHLLVERERLRLTRGPRENGSRPAIDPLFRSAAVHHGSRVVGIVLTGLHDDGTAGLEAIQRCGGLTVVQDPDDAAYSDMPLSALRNLAVDHVLPIAQIGSLIAQLAQERAPDRAPPPLDLVRETEISGRYGTPDDLARLGEPTTLDCPECGGPLWDSPPGTTKRFRCWLGHAFSEQALAAGQADQIERSLLVAMRTLEERARMLSRLAAQATKGALGRQAEHYLRERDEATVHSKVLRELLTIL